MLLCEKKEKKNLLSSLVSPFLTWGPVRVLTWLASIGDTTGRETVVITGRTM